MRIDFKTILSIFAVVLGVGSSAFAQEGASNRFVVKGDVQTACVASPRPNGRPSTISAGILNGKALELPKPEGFCDALGRKVQGTVSVQVIVGENGSVSEAAGVSGNKLLHPVAVAAARLAKFEPVLLSGFPVKVSGVIFYKF